MSQALDTILGDVDSILEVTVEIDSALRSDGTLRTWYFTSHVRETGPTETPANETFKPFLKPGGVLGPLSQSLTEDILFSGLAQNNPGTLTLIQPNLDSDELSVMHDYVFAGYEMRVKIGRTTDLYAAFERFRTTTIKVDPDIKLTSEGLQASFQLSGALTRALEETLILKKYLGIPHCLRLSTVTGLVTVTRVAAHDVSRFTIGGKIRISAIPTSEDRRVWTKVASFPTNSHWRIVITANTGVLNLTASSNGAADIVFNSPGNVCDGNWHTILYSRDDANTAWVALDDQEEVVYTPTGIVNTSAADLLFGRAFVGNNQEDFCDARYLDRYMTPEEARSYFAVRSNGDDLNVIGLWRFDDNSGGTVNDYSATGADGVISGVLNTDYSWQPNDLGEPELAGKLYPLAVGNVLNAKADLIDAARERYRGNVDAIGWHTSGSNTNLIVRSQGTVLTGGGVDYTAPSSGGDGVFSMTTAEAEPVTYDLLNNGTAEENVYPSNVVVSLLTERTRFTSSDISNVNPTTLLCPWPSGYWTNQDTTAQKALSEILGESGMCYFEEPLGSLWIDMLLPPTGYGPYGEPCLDFLGRGLDFSGRGGGVEFGDIGDISGSFSIACWVKVHVADQTAFNFGASAPNIGTYYLAAKSNTAGNYATYFQAIGSDAGKLGFTIGAATLKTPAGLIAPHTWHFVGFVMDDTANTMKIYSAPKGSSLSEVASGSIAFSPVPNSSPLRIGGNGYPYMSVQHVQVWSAVKSLSQLQALMATPPVGNETNLSVYVPLNEGIGNPIEVVSQTSGEITGTLATQGSPQWAPKFLVNLDDTPSIKLTDFHHTHPAWNVVVGYAKNRFPMNNSDIDSGVSQNNRLALTRKGLDVRFESTKIRDRFKGAKKINLDSPITDQESATRLLRSVVNRFGTDGYVGVLTFPPGRDVPALGISRLACGLQIGDEIGLTASIPSQLQTPRSFRVASVAPNPLQLGTTVAIVG